MKSLAYSCLTLLTGSFIAAQPAGGQDIPYRYSISEGFILAIDDASRRSFSRDDPTAWAVLNGLAETLESDRFRIPVAYGRTLAWNLGAPFEARLDRDSQLTTFQEARQQSADRAMPATVLFLRLSERNETIRLRADVVNLARGESRLRFSSDPIAISLPEGCDPKAVCASNDVLEALQPFFIDAGNEILDFLGPAPPRGYGAVPPPWLIEPINYRIDIRGLEEDITAEIVDVLTAELDHYLGHEITRQDAQRVVLEYETRAPSWWVAEQIHVLGNELGLAFEITPKLGGFRIE